MPNKSIGAWLMCMMIFTVVKCSAELKGERDSLEDEPRSGRPADAIRQEMIDRVERLVLTNLRQRWQTCTTLGQASDSMLALM